MALASRPDIAGLVLAGGESRRLAGGKALAVLDGKPLVKHAIDRLAPQVGDLWISVRGDPGPLAGFGYPTLADDRPIALGPLAGIVAGLRLATSKGHPLLAVVPCDTPFLPDDLVAVLHSGLGEAALAVVKDDAIHPTIGLWRTAALGAAADALEAGRLRLGSLCQALEAVEVAAPSHWRSSALFNVNTSFDLDAATSAKDG